jgi:hypothetical protein
LQFFSRLEITDKTQSGLKHFLSFFLISCFLRTVRVTGKRSMGTLLVAQLIEAPRYKSESCGFDSRW